MKLPFSILGKLRASKAASIPGRLLGGASALGALTLPLDLDYILSGPGTRMSRAQNGRNARSERFAEVPDTMERMGAASELAGDDTALKYARLGMEGINSLKQIGIRSQSNMSLEDLIADDQGLLGQVSQQSPPTLAEIYASAGVI